MTPRCLIDPARLAGSALLRRQSDERLVDLVRAGNRAAFEAIDQRYRGELLRYCNRLLPARGEDAVQQTLANAHSALLSGSAAISLRPWLYRIAHNQAVSLLRQNGWDHAPMSELPVTLDEATDSVHERRDELRGALAAINDLPDRQRDALVLREIEGHSYDDIGQRLGVSGGAVRQLVSRARSSLRAGVTALTPPELLLRLTDAGAPAGVTWAGGTAATGAGAMAAKAGAAAVLAVAVAGGATGFTTHDNGARAKGSEATAGEAAQAGGDATRAPTTRGAVGDQPGALGSARQSSDDRVRAARAARKRRRAGDAGVSAGAGLLSGGGPSHSPVNPGNDAGGQLGVDTREGVTGRDGGDAVRDPGDAGGNDDGNDAGDEPGSDDRGPSGGDDRRDAGTESVDDGAADALGGDDTADDAATADDTPEPDDAPDGNG